jgi:hypothetical protein
MITARARSGVTLIELLLLVLVFGVLAGLTLPVTLRARESAAARSARDATASVIARARLLALARGSARVITDIGSAKVRLESPIGLLAEPPLELGATLGVNIAVDRAAGPDVMIDFDALGLGRLANRTFRFRRGAAEARLTLSSYGRPRRW